MPRSFINAEIFRQVRDNGWLGIFRLSCMSRRFEVNAPFAPAGDQPQAIRELVEGIEAGLASQILLGVTGSGKISIGGPQTATNRLALAVLAILADFARNTAQGLGHLGQRFVCKVL